MDKGRWKIKNTGMTTGTTTREGLERLREFEKGDHLGEGLRKKKTDWERGLRDGRGGCVAEVGVVGKVGYAIESGRDWLGWEVGWEVALHLTNGGTGYCA
ncbi:unnamed protein product [Ilex paraguariensis]|uniref:Uncharacterized protein n=1 Tax=Ilex paraguariensis TaxID=185542 RepID=A0ABC8R7P1_9AQUA